MENDEMTYKILTITIQIKQTFIKQLFKFVNWTLNHQWTVVRMWMLFAWAVGFVGYLEAIPNHGNEPLVWDDSPLLSVCSAALWSVVNMMYQSSGNLNNGYIVLSKILALIGVVIIIALTLVKNILEQARLRSTNQIPHTLVIGLGENNRHYLDSEIRLKNEESIIIIESDPQNIYIDMYKNKGFNIFIGNTENYPINFRQLQRIVISSGDDMSNLTIAGTVIGKIKDMDKENFGGATTAYIHLQNQDYKALFHKNILGTKHNLPLDFKIYSYNDDAARELFENHTVVGDFVEIVKNSQSYHVTVVGDGDLAERIIYHLCMQTALPNKNHCTIHCINPDSEKFMARLRSKFTGIDQIDWITLQGHSVEYNNTEFYALSLWHTDFLTNVIVCDDEEKNNLEITVNINDTIYLKQAVNDTLRTKIHFALYHNSEFGQAISCDSQNEYKQFFAFGDASSICSREHFIDEKYENIAKLIHKGYGEKYLPEILSDLSDNETMKRITEKWHDTTSFSDRDSNRSQALHINTKLMSLGYKKIQRTDLLKEKLLETNRTALQEHFDAFFQETINIKALTEASCQLGLDYAGFEYVERPLSDLFEKIRNGKSVVSKLVLAEHERWNAFHYLNGWSYSGIKNKKIKEHNCLIPLSDFREYPLQKTILFDLYSILYLPNYLASTGYEIVKIDFDTKNNKCDDKDQKNDEIRITIGISGHRNIDSNDQNLKLLLTKELKKIIDINDNITLLSPLAEGSDRLFVHTAIEVGSDKIDKLRVMMPFKKEEYLKDFESAESKKEFIAMTLEQDDKKYKGIGVEVNEVPCSQDKEDGYLKSGQWTANHSDILFVIWDGKPANGKGGTAEIVEFAKIKNKKIVMINPVSHQITYYPAN